MSGGTGGGSISPQQIQQVHDFMSANTGPAAPQATPYTRPGTTPQGGPQIQMQPSQIEQILKPIQQGNAGAPQPNPIAAAQQQGMDSGLTAGLGAGDAAGAAATASGAMLPGSGSASAVGNMMSTMGAQQRAAIQKKIDMAKMLMGGG